MNRKITPFFSSSSSSSSSSLSCLIDDSNNNPPSTSLSNPSNPSQRRQLNSNHSCNNVLRLLSRREICPRGRHSSRKLWSEDATALSSQCPDLKTEVLDAKRGLVSWVEAESLMHLSAKYCPLVPPPRSTIAAAFSPDGKTLASTHGDHTVKIIDCQTGKCLKVLRGHRRTPWVVRFHPLRPEILASGSLDHEVRIWNAITAECIGFRDFHHPIASIAFHANGEFLAVVSGHKLYIWRYSFNGETSSPTIVLKTRRSLRAVHFHPLAAPFLLTAEVNNLNLSESSMTPATSPGNLSYPPPTVYLIDAHSNGRPSLVDEIPLTSLPFLIWPSFTRGRTSMPQTEGNVSSHEPDRVEGSNSIRLLTYSTPAGQYELLLSPMDQNASSPAREETQTDSLVGELNNEAPQLSMGNMDTTEVQPDDRNNQSLRFDDQMSWELPFLHGWLVGQSQASHRMMGTLNNSTHGNLTALSGVENHILSSMFPANIAESRGTDTGRSGLRTRSSRARTVSMMGPGDSAAFSSLPRNESDTQPSVSRIQSEIATSLAAADLPCTVKLRIWPHDAKDPCAPLDAEKCRLTIPHVVLCSEMGAHFSPSGKFLAVCVACVLPHSDPDPGLQSQLHRNDIEAATSPTRHPLSARQVMYELRIYSLEEATFGLVLASRAIRAAHCLTSIQFSPTSEHLLLAYGRRHGSLLKSVVIDRESAVPIYTILEVYRVSDMELVKVLPSAEDEVNVACFHPFAGGGLVYGTKEGKLRILQFDGSYGFNNKISTSPNEEMLEVPTYALEC